METPSIQTPSSSIRSALGHRDFRLYWTGQTVSMLGDQLHTVAEAVFSLAGGAVVDRLSPRRVMLFADLARLLLTASLAVTILTGTLETWMILVYALITGSIYGIFGPASTSILPRILPERDLEKGNLLSQGSAQLIGVLGPVLAAGWIALFPDQYLGIAILIALDSITFIASTVTLGLMRAGSERAPGGEKINLSAVRKSTREGIAYVSGHPPLRFLFLVVAAAGFAFAGPVMVGIPYLAGTRFPEGVAAYGIILSGYAAGNLAGILLSSRMPLRDRSQIHIPLAATFIAFGMGLAALGWIATTWVAAFDLMLMGLLNGSISILLLTGLQRNTPQEFLGRVMSIVIFANMALMPLSQAIAGALLSWNVPLLFVGAAALMFGIALYIYLAGGRYQIGDQLL